MSKNERWNTRHEIKRSFPDSTDKAHGAGPVIYTEHGRKYIDDSEANCEAAAKEGLKTYLSKGGGDWLELFGNAQKQ